MNENYYAEAKTWYQEHYETLQCSMNKYRIFLLLMIILFILCLMAIITLLPLKQYVYRLIEVNKTTGEVLVLKEIEENNFKTNWVINRYFIHQYIEARESYSLDDIKRKFNIVLAMSDKNMADRYMADTIDTNPTSPIKVFNNNYYKEVEDVSINSLNDNTAIARYKTVLHNKNNINEIKTEAFQVVIKWNYVNERLSLAGRDKNPLGFTVSYYQTSPVFTKEN